jgi:hypothetical protein
LLLNSSRSKARDAKAKGGDTQAKEEDSQEQACKRGRFSRTSEKGGGVQAHVHKKIKNINILI